MADNFEAFKKRFKSGKVKMLANPAPLPGPGGIVRAAVGKAVQMGASAGSSWRQKITEASNRPYKGRGSGVPAKTGKARGNINRAYTPESIKMPNPARSQGTALATTTGKAVATRGTTSPAGRGPMPSGGVVKTSKRVSAMTAAKANVPQSKDAKVVTAVRPETPGSYMAKAIGGGPKSRQGSQSPSMSVGGGPKSRQGSQSPMLKKKAAGVNQMAMAQSNAAAKKKKAGATTSAAPAVSKPKRKSHFQRRMAERYAIGTSGKSL